VEPAEWSPPLSRCGHDRSSRYFEELLRGVAFLERETRFELATFCLEGRRSTS
jgi:hypothetical protein